MRWVNRIGWGILLAWAGFWLWFNLAAGMGEFAEAGRVGDSLGHLAIALPIVGVVALTWYRRRVGAGSLLGLAVFAAWFFHAWRSPMLSLILIAPAVVAAILFLIAAWRSGRPAAA